MPFPKASWAKTAVFFLAAFFSKILYLVYFGTVRLKVVLPRSGDLGAEPSNVVYACWHSKTFLLLPYIRYRSIVVLTLLDWKNFFYDKLCRLFGCKTIPTVNDALSTRRLVRCLKEGKSVLLAVDGPKGPRGVIRPGVRFLAEVTERPIRAFNVHAERSFRLKARWDHYEIPYPFSKATITLSEPFWASPDKREQVLSRMTQALGAY